MIGATPQIEVQKERVSSDTCADTAVMNSKTAVNTENTNGNSTTAGAEAAKAAVATPTVAAAAPPVAVAAPAVAATAPVQQHVSDLSTMRSALAASKSSRVRVAQYAYLFKRSDTVLQDGTCVASSIVDLQYAHSHFDTTLQLIAYHQQSISVDVTMLSSMLHSAYSLLTNICCFSNI
jgi:hypothetical protein